MRTRIPRLIRCITSKWFLLAWCALLIPAMASAQVAPTSLFQLDGTAAQNGSYPQCTYLVGGVPTTTTCDFWDLLNDSGGVNPTGSPGHSRARTFISGVASSEVFIGGGSKDPIDVTSWSCTSKSSPDKDTLTNGYAAAYTAPNGDLVTIFGADRFSVNGDANIGIWFFQQSVVCNPATGTFSNAHTTGDILVLSAFTVGGTVPTISVFKWQPACLAAAKNPAPGPLPDSCADMNLEVLFSAGSLCDSGGTLSTLPACAITNSGTIPVTWPYPTSSSPTPSSIPSPAFFTGGADITSLLKVPVCFTSFLEETRSSQSTSAVLKDFIGGAFPVCHISVNKTYTCNSFNANGTFNYSYGGNVINDGAGELFNVTVKDTPVGSTTPVTYSCGNMLGGTSKAFPSADCPQPAGTTNTFTTGTHPAMNVADARGDTSSNASTPPVTAEATATSSDATATSCSPRPGLSVTKQCVTAFQLSGSQILVRVDYVGDVRNTGQDNLSNVNVTDDADGKTFGPFSLIPGQSVCYTNGQTESAGPPATGCPTLAVTTGVTSSGPTGSASYFPGSAGNPFGLTLGRISFTDTVNATGTDPFGNTVPLTTQPPAKASATCLICPFGSCPTS